MKKLISYLLVVMLIPAFVLTGCKDDKDDPTPVETGNFTTLSTYMINQNLDLPTLLSGWVIDPKPTTVDGGIVDVENDCTIPDWTVFDIRSETDFNKGHVKGSFNVTLANIVTEAEAINNPEAKILVMCYSGQTAGRAVMALRLSGFPNAKVSKFGFSAWSNNSEFDKWSAKTDNGNIAVGNANWVTTASADLPTNAYPTWTTTSTDGATILAEKINEMLAYPSAEWGVAPADVLATPTNYSIYNYWVEADYTGFGHFAGAYRVEPGSLNIETVSMMNPENSNVIYCYTGQTSSIVTAWLNVIGYKVSSVFNGVNALSYTALSEAGKPHWHFPYHEYTYEVTE